MLVKFLDNQININVVKLTAATPSNTMNVTLPVLVAVDLLIMRCIYY